MDKLVIYSDQDEVSNKVHDIQRTVFIDSCKRDAYYQHHDFSERRFQTVKTTTNTVLDRTNAPP